MGSYLRIFRRESKWTCCRSVGPFPSNFCWRCAYKNLFQSARVLLQLIVRAGLRTSCSRYVSKDGLLSVVVQVLLALGACQITSRLSARVRGPLGAVCVKGTLVVGACWWTSWMEATLSKLTLVVGGCYGCKRCMRPSILIKGGRRESQAIWQPRLVEPHG